MSEPESPARGPVRSELVVDLDALRHNVRTLAAAVSPAALMVVVKADGYGHGMVPVARAAREAGADWLGVATLDEALALRAAGDTGPLLCWLAVPGEDWAAALDAGIEVTLSTTDQLAEVVRAAAGRDRPARVQLKVDTGLSRNGATTAEWPGLVAAARRAETDGTLQVAGVWSHFACADEPDHPANDAQEQAFAAALGVAEAAGLRPALRHLCNSAGALTRPQARYDLVRCGLAAYGLSPVPDHRTSQELGLVPVMTARAQVAVTKRVPAGAGVSYGHTYVTEQETTLALVPVGYGDGVPVHGSSVAPVQVAGRRATVSGRVCMDQLVVDVGDQPVAPGDEVVLFGAAGGSGDGAGDGTGDVPTAEEWARACGTISYEIVTRIGGRFRRRWTGTSPHQEDA